ncbi:MAG: site-2 protease family protein [Ruminococcaceae bacterium]|nr:site-2 protease family protein [Oscillospiraceae bacterium]
MIIPAAFLSVVFHEISHGYVAYLLGDPTAKLQKRLSLNPLQHLDIIGLLSMIIFGFGWAKPVPVNPYYFKRRKLGMSLVAIAGPLSNILCAIIALVLCKWITVIPIRSEALFSFMEGLAVFLVIFTVLNIGLAVFNLIPISPLDGSKILIAVLPNHLYIKILQFEQYGFLILILLLNLPWFDSLISMLRNGLFDLLYGLFF